MTESTKTPKFTIVLPPELKELFEGCQVHYFRNKDTSRMMMISTKQFQEQHYSATPENKNFYPLSKLSVLRGAGDKDGNPYSVYEILPGTEILHETVFEGEDSPVVPAASPVSNPIETNFVETD